MQIVKCRLVTDDPKIFLPLSVLTPKDKEQDAIWLLVNNGHKNPIKLIYVFSTHDKLGLDGQYIDLQLGDNPRLEQGDQLYIDQYRLYVSKVTYITKD